MVVSNEEQTFLLKAEMDITKVIDRTESIARSIGFRTDDIQFLKLVIEEACTNAYEYCKKTQQSEYLVRWGLSPKKLDISIKHKGEAFDIEKPKEASNSIRGRGLCLIKNLMDEVHVHKDGEYVELLMKKTVATS